MGRDLVTAEHVHGKTGLDGPDLPRAKMPLQDKAGVDFIIETLRTEPAGSVTLCPLGPLTNIATALERAPDIAPRIARIVLMGGAIRSGQHYPHGRVQHLRGPASRPISSCAAVSTW